jgi:thioredoxin reductase (NADPH)
MESSFRSETISRYLIDRIEALQNVTLHTHTEITRLNGSRESGLQSVVWNERADPEARQRAPLPHETTQHGVFAVGDVRAGSVKRVASAVSEGSVVVSQLHTFLAESRQR